MNTCAEILNVKMMIFSVKAHQTPIKHFYSKKSLVQLFSCQSQCQRLEKCYLELEKF